MNTKKILLVVGFIIMVLFFGFALYWVFFRSTPVPPSTEPGYNGANLPGIGPGNITIIDENTNVGNIGLPWKDFIDDQVSDVANGGLTTVYEVTDTPVKGVVSSGQNLQYYDTDKQQFFRVNANGEMELLADKKFYEVDTITWAGSGNKAILEYPDGSNILYNFNTGKQVTLPPELEDFDFNNVGNQITAKWIGDNEDNNWLVAANDDGSGLFLIEPLGDQSYNTIMDFSPDNQIAALYTSYIDAQRQEVYPIGLHGENYKAFTVNGAGFESEWSPEGNTLLYSVYNDSNNYNPNLWITKGKTSELGDLKVSLNLSTWPDKCTFAGESTLYCAAPQGLPRGAGFYPEIADQYPDNFYSIDLNSGIRTLIASPIGAGGNYTAYNLVVSPDGSILYFTDIDSGTLQSIRLK